MPKFHVVTGNEFGLSGIANPAGGEHGSMHVPSLSMLIDDCAITSGEVALPPGFTGTAYNAKFLNFDLSIVNVGEAWAVPNPTDNPELFITWPCNNPKGTKQLKDFVLINFTDDAGKVVKEAKYCGLFLPDTFLNNQVYFVSTRFPFIGQRIQINDLPDGVYRIEIKVNPIYGECVPAIVTVKFTGHDVALQAPEDFPRGLVWEPFAEGKGT